MIKKFALVLVAVFMMGCAKSFEVPTLNDVKDYKMLYQLKDKDIIDTVKIPNGYKIIYK